MAEALALEAQRTWTDALAQRGFGAVTALEKAKGVWMEAQAVRKAKSRGKHGGYEDRECVSSEIFLEKLQLLGVIESLTKATVSCDYSSRILHDHSNANLPTLARRERQPNRKVYIDAPSQASKLIRKMS